MADVVEIHPHFPRSLPTKCPFTACRRCRFFAYSAIISAVLLTVPLYVFWLGAGFEPGLPRSTALLGPQALNGFLATAHRWMQPLFPALFGMFLGSCSVTILWAFCLTRRESKRAFYQVTFALLVFGAGLALARWDPDLLIQWWFS